MISLTKLVDGLKVSFISGGSRRSSRGSYLELLYRQLGGNLALGTRLLDQQRYSESRCAFLACRALDAFEDLAPDRAAAIEGIQDVAAYLTRRTDRLPDVRVLIAHRQGDEWECALVTVLPDLRNALDMLKPSAISRVYQLIDTVAKNMVKLLENDARHSILQYGTAVLGSITSYAFSVLGVETEEMTDFAAMGVLVQAANDLRDLDFDHKRDRKRHTADLTERELLLNLTVVEMAPQVLICLGRIRFGVLSRERGIVTYMGLSIARFFAQRIGVLVPPLFQRPWVTALLATVTHQVYERVLVEIEQLVYDCIGRLCTEGGSSKSTKRMAAPARRRSRLQSLFEARIIAAHPQLEQGRILRNATGLIHAALALCADLPRTPISERRSENSGAAILMVSDYLLACAVGMVSKLGTAVLAEAGMSAATLAEAIHQDNASGDSRGEIARLLSLLVGKALGVNAERLRSHTAKHQEISVRLYQADRTPWPWRIFVARRIAIAGVWEESQSLARRLWMMRNNDRNKVNWRPME